MKLSNEYLDTTITIVRSIADTTRQLVTLTDLIEQDMAACGYTADAYALAGLTEDLPDLISAIAVLIEAYGVKRSRFETGSAIAAYLDQLEGGTP